MLAAEVLLLLLGLLTVHGSDPDQDAGYYGTDSPVDAPDIRFFPTDWLWELLEVSNTCDPNPCHHGGSCQQQSDAGYTCSCPEPYVGKKCQSVRNVCENVTCGGGDCVIKLHESPFYECKCRPPFHGPHCGQLPASPCEPNHCQNGGSCIKGDHRDGCACPDGYKGRFCEVAPSDCYEGNGESYGGVVSVTEEGEDCLHWNSYAVLRRGNNFYRNDSAVNNHCRNPDADKKPWCYIQKQRRVEWSYCNVRKCSEEPVPTSEPVAPEPGYSQFSQCGKKMPGKILDGCKSYPGETPWQVSVQFRSEGTSENFTHACGGTLLSSCWVLTAAHCIKEYFDYQVMLGGVRRDKKEANEQIIPVIQKICHEDFGWNRENNALYNDIALLKLNVTDGHHCAKESAFVRTACLSDQTFPPGTECMVSGWGQTENSKNGDASNMLLKTKVFLIPQNECKDEKSHVLSDSSMFCAGSDSGADSCDGDSGGPLVCKENGTYYLTGVVSFTPGNTCGERSTIYADVHPFLSWIHEKTTENQSTEHVCRMRTIENK